MSFLHPLSLRDLFIVRLCAMNVWNPFFCPLSIFRNIQNTTDWGVALFSAAHRRLSQRISFPLHSLHEEWTNEWSRAAEKDIQLFIAPQRHFFFYLHLYLCSSPFPLSWLGVCVCQSYGNVCVKGGWWPSKRIDSWPWRIPIPTQLPPTHEHAEEMSAFDKTEKTQRKRILAKVPSLTST